MSTDLQTAASSGFGAIASSFVTESLASIVVWIIAMGAVIFCDLITGLAKSYKERVKIRFSSACRNTISKLCVYYSLVVCASLTQAAIGNEIEINKWSCLFVILIEFSSICNNILGWHGFALDFNKIVTLILKKKLDAETDDVKDIVVAQKRGKNGRFVKKS